MLPAARETKASRHQAPQLSVVRPRIGQRAGDAAVPERPLDEVDVTTLAVDAHRERVSQRVNRDMPLNAGFHQPLPEPTLHVPGADPGAGPSDEQRPRVAALEEPPQMGAY